ncbi:hypothetical protein [Luteolibacter soli]|uniref:Lipoprotein n=1 Tax=Luteolibacter soli TaxID=3135280 RepID=A0ABU9AZI8_9BACT
MSLRRIAFTLSLATIGLVGCNSSPTTSQSREASSSVDSWYHPVTDRSLLDDGADLPTEDIFRVSQDHLSSAEKQLQDVDCVEVTLEQADELIGFHIDPRNGMRLFLVRAVALNPDTGHFTGTLAGSALSIHHGSLGRSAVPMKRQPLVIRLSKKPEKVFVSCSMAE